MDLLREVRNALTDGSIPLSRALLKAKVLASTLRSPELREFVDRELRGYRHDEEIPDYRRLPIDSVGTFCNIRLTPVTNHPIPVSSIPEPLQPFAQRYDCADSVGVIEHVLETAKEHMIWTPWPSDAVAALGEANIGGYGFTCTEASRCYSTDRLVSILDSVRNTVLDIVLDLSETFPDRVDSEEQLAALPTQQVLTIIHNHIEGDFTTVGSGGTVHQQPSIQVNANDLSGLLSALEHVGVPDVELRALESAMARQQAAPVIQSTPSGETR